MADARDRYAEPARRTTAGQGVVYAWGSTTGKQARLHAMLDVGRILRLDAAASVRSVTYAEYSCRYFFSLSWRVARYALLLTGTRTGGDPPAARSAHQGDAGIARTWWCYRPGAS